MKLSKYISDFNIDFNFDPIIESTEMILVNHQFASELILPSIKIFIRSIISRFSFSSSALSNLLTTIVNSYTEEGKDNCLEFGILITEELNVLLSKNNTKLSLNICEIIKTIFFRKDHIASFRLDLPNDILGDEYTTIDFVFLEITESLPFNLITYLNYVTFITKTDVRSLEAVSWVAHLLAVLFKNNIFTVEQMCVWLSVLLLFIFIEFRHQKI